MHSKKQKWICLWILGIFKTTQANTNSEAGGDMIQWLLIGVGVLVLILVILIIASILYCFRKKIFKRKKPKKTLTQSSRPDPQLLQPPSSGGQWNTNQSSEACQNQPAIPDNVSKNPNKPINVPTKKLKNKSIQTAIPSPVGIRGLKNTDELYRLALTAENREERNIYLDATIESANEELIIWENSPSANSNDISMLPLIAKRILKARKSGVKLIPTKNPTKLIPEQMDGLTYEQINDLALIETYPNVRYALFERASELIKRAIEDSAPPDALFFDKDNIEPLLYQYQLGISETNEEPQKAIEKRNKLINEILKKKETCN